MMIDKKSFLLGALTPILGYGAYFMYEYLKPCTGLATLNKLEANNIHELMGYLHGLIRGAGTEEAAKERLSEWRDYWIKLRPELANCIQYWYNYGISKIKEIIG